METENIKPKDVNFRDKLKELQRQAIKQVREDRKQSNFRKFYKIAIPVFIILVVAFYFLGKTRFGYQLIATNISDQPQIKEYRFPVPPDSTESGGAFGKTNNKGNFSSSNSTVFDLEEENLLETENEVLLKNQGLNPSLSGNDSSSEDKDSATDSEVEWLETEVDKNIISVHGIRISHNLVCSEVKDRDCVVQQSNFTLGQLQNPHIWMEVFSDSVPYVLKHVYYHEGRKYVEVPLTIKYRRMRTWSYITLNDFGQLGFWHVETVAEDGSILGRVYFNVTAGR